MAITSIFFIITALFLTSVFPEFGSQIYCINHKATLTNLITEMSCILLCIENKNTIQKCLSTEVLTNLWKKYIYPATSFPLWFWKDHSFLTL